MKRAREPFHAVRIVAETAFAAVFAVVLFSGKMQIWLLLFAAGVLCSVFFGRLFCSWACPMGTLFRPIGWLYAKWRVTRLKTPRFFTMPAVRYALLAGFLAAMLVTQRLGLGLPLLAVLTGISVLVTLLCEEAFWHNAVCPFGTILSLTSRASRKNVRIDEERCTACGKCQRVCPSHAIDTLGTGKRRIRKHDCLACRGCEPECSVEAIAYR